MFPVRPSKLEEHYSNANIRNDINLRAILGSFMIGTEKIDVARLLTMMGAVGGGGFQKGYIRHQKEVCERILDRSRQIVRRTLLYEIELTFKEKI